MKVSLVSLITILLKKVKLTTSLIDVYFVYFLNTLEIKYPILAETIIQRTGHKLQLCVQFSGKRAQNGHISILARLLSHLHTYTLVSEQQV